jgi:hypothetical protein
VCADAAASSDAASTSSKEKSRADRRPVLPNLVDGCLLVGHQGHALCISDWVMHLDVGLHANLACEHVDSQPSRSASDARIASGGAAWRIVEVRVPSDGRPLTDKPGDADRLLEALPDTLAAIAECTTAGRLAFVHCQQGRSRAGSVATAHLLTSHADWALVDAVRFLAARRPETEIAEEYLVALEEWATGTLGRPASLPSLREELPRQIRPAPNNRKPTGSNVPVGGGGGEAVAAPAASPPRAKEESVAAKGAILPPDSPLGGGMFGPAAVRRATSGGLARPTEG